MLYSPGVIRHFPFCALRARVLYSIKKGEFTPCLIMQKVIEQGYFLIADLLALLCDCSLLLYLPL